MKQQSIIMGKNKLYLLIIFIFGLSIHSFGQYYQQIDAVKIVPNMKIDTLDSIVSYYYPRNMVNNSLCPTGWHIPNMVEYQYLMNMPKHGYYNHAKNRIENIMSSYIWVLDSLDGRNFSYGYNYTCNEYILQEVDTTLFFNVRCIKENGCHALPRYNEYLNNGKIIKVRDVQNNIYQVVELNGRCWMKENLRTTTTPQETDIPHKNRDVNYPAYNENNGNYYYNYYSATMVCPDGWKLPSQEEYEQLFQEYNMRELCSENDWENSDIQNSPGYHSSYNNHTEFSAKPCGHINNNSVKNRFKMSEYWTTDHYDEYYSCKMNLRYDETVPNHSYYEDGTTHNINEQVVCNKSVYCPIRCIRIQ